MFSRSRLYDSMFLSELSLNQVSAMQMMCGELSEAIVDLNSSHLLSSEVGLV